MKLKNFSRILFLFLIVLTNLTFASEIRAASASGKVGQIITLSLRDYSSTGKSIYNDLLDGKIYSTSYTWTSSSPGYTTWVDKANTFSYVKFSKPGTYTVNYDLKYTFSGSSRFYSFSGTWTVTVEQNGPTGVSVRCDDSSINVGETTKVYASVQGQSEIVTWSKSNTNVSISSSGNTCTVKGISSGSTKITATTSNGYSDYIYITINESNSISLDKYEMELNVGDNAVIEASITGPNSNKCNWKITSGADVVNLVSDGLRATVTGISEGDAVVTAYANDGTYALCRIHVNKPKPTELYAVGKLTKWEFLDDFKFTSVDDDTYELYLDYLSGEFKISNIDWSENYGNDNELIYGSDINLILNNGNNIHVEKPLYSIKLKFIKSSKTLTCEYAVRPVDQISELFPVWLSTGEGGALGIYLPAGSRLPFFIYSSDGWEPKYFNMTEEDYNKMLFDEDNSVYVSQVISEALAIEVYFERIGETSLTNISNDNVKLIRAQDGFKLLNVPSQTSIDTYNINGVKVFSAPSKEVVSDVDIPLAKGQSYIIRLSNGHEFKIMR